MFINVQHQKIKTPSPNAKKLHCNINDTTPSHHPLIIIYITAPSPHRHHRDITKTTRRHHRDKTETRPRQDRDTTETRPRHDRDKTETRPKQDRDMIETSPRQDQDILSEFFSGACAAPGRLIHVRPQAYRYWGTIHETNQQSVDDRYGAIASSKESLISISFLHIEVAISVIA